MDLFRMERGFLTSDSDKINGYRVGVGIEFALSEMFHIKGEYRYSDYGEYTYQGIASGVSVSRSQFVAGLSAHF
jgi:outer membrane immunogenic protein